MSHSLPSDSDMLPTLNSSISTLTNIAPKPLEIVPEEIPFVPTCFKDDLDKLRQAEGLSWSEVEIRLLSESLKEIGRTIPSDLKSFIA